MALASNTREQLAKRLQADLQIRFPASVITPSVSTAGDPLIAVDAIAMLSITRRTYNGFNVVAELSASAAEGLPEHITWLIIKNDQSQLITAKLALTAKAMGTSSFKFGAVAGAPVAADVVDANVLEEIANDARLGAVGQ